MNIIQEIKEKAKKNNFTIEISGSAKTKQFYNKTLKNPYKIISVGDNSEKFKHLQAWLVQTKECDYHTGIYGYEAYIIQGDFKIVVEQNNLARHAIICVYKIK